MARTATNRGRFLTDNLPSVSDIQARVNKRYNELFLRDKEGNRRPFVCSVCDEIAIKKRDICIVTIQGMKGMGDVMRWENFNDIRRKPEIEGHYKFECNVSSYSGDLGFLEGMALSPRGTLFQKRRRRVETSPDLLLAHCSTINAACHITGVKAFCKIPCVHFPA